MIACLAIPGFELRAALRSRPRLALRPGALSPAEGVEPLLGPVTAAAEAVQLHEAMFKKLWNGSVRGAAGAMLLRKLMKRTLA